MNKLCVTKKGLELLNPESQQHEPEPPKSLKSFFNETKRTSSLPQLISKAHILERQQISNRLSKMTLRIKDLKQKGLKKMMIEREDNQLKTILQQQFTGRKQYLRNIVPSVVKMTRDNHHFGNLNSRFNRGRAYLDRLEHNFDHKFVFKAPVQLQEE